MNFAGKSDKGLMRSLNEDAFCLIGGVEGGFVLLAVADGMGGHLAGDIASRTAVSVIEESLRVNPLDISSEGAVDARLLDIVKAANEAIYRKSLTEPGCAGMGTTLIIAVVYENRVRLAHVGDSCAYYLRGGELNKITTDHTYVEELVRIGSLTREEAARHPRRNVITRAVGCAPKVTADLYSTELRSGDRLLLCTDGLSKMLVDSEIADAVSASDDAGSICGTLIDKANHKGGLDNITAIVYIYSRAIMPT